MPKFIVRVELPGKPEADYAQLHRDMWAAQYYRVILGDSGKWWHLPHGEYTAETGDEWTAVKIRNEVGRIASKSHDRPRVFVSEYSVGAWRGLRPVTEDDPEPDDS